MSLALPTNIAQRPDCDEMIQGVIESLSDGAVCHIADGICTSHTVTAEERPLLARQVAISSVVYVLSSGQGQIEPIIAFIANQSLGYAHVQYVIDGLPAPETPGLPQHTIDMLGVYSRSLFAETDWLNAITINADVSRIDGQFDLRVEAGDNFTITLADARHRPYSSRKSG